MPVALILFVCLIVWESRRLSREEDAKIRKKKIKDDEELRKRIIQEHKAWEEANRKIPFNPEMFQKERERIEKGFSLLNEHIFSLEEMARKGDLVAYGEWKWELKKMHVLKNELRHIRSTTKDMTERELARHYLSLIDARYRSEKIQLDCNWQE